MIYWKDAQSNQNLLCFFKQREQKNFAHKKNYLYTPILVTTQELDSYVEGTRAGPMVEGGVWQVHNEKRISKPSMVSSYGY
jgi:hypothetical protein